MATAREVIKKWFENFKKPTQEQFWAWLDSYWHKNDKIPMSSVQNLELSLQNVVTADQFNNHVNDGNAHKALFDSKVDKENGKGLISDAEREQIQINKNKRVVGHTITGDVNKVSTLILDDGSVIQADFTDVAPAGPDVMLNSLNFDKDTGVLTGVRSDEQQITVDLNGRFALLTHTHAFSDLTGTENVASKQDITDAISTKFNGTAKQLMLANGTYSSALLVGGAISSSWTYTQDWCGSTIFVKGQATINLQGLGNHESVAFKKCFDGGQITFTCNGKTIVKRGADEFNGADGSNAVVSVVDNKCYIDINNYE